MVNGRKHYWHCIIRYFRKKVYIVEYQRGKRRETGAIDCTSDLRDYMRNMRTTIQTRINSKFIISSVYREYRNEHFSQWAWETLLYRGENVENEYNVCNSVDNVIKLHYEIWKEIRQQEKWMRGDC